MKEIEIFYNPYKMETKLLIDGENVCGLENYETFNKLIGNNTPLQTWVEPIFYEKCGKWKGILNEIVNDDHHDEVHITFHGRRIDYEDLKRACDIANKNRENKLTITYRFEEEWSDTVLMKNIHEVMKGLLSEQFRKIVEEAGQTKLKEEYEKLEENYKRAKNKEFKIVFAGLFSSGKSTILNALIHHDIIPCADVTCTSKICRLKHDKSLSEGEITLECFDEQGNSVVEKQMFTSDKECLTKFWEITPLKETKSNPENVETIEIGLDLSHLYPSKEMEKEFNLVIVDTPGCNSSKTNGVNENDEKVNKDRRTALDAITNGEKEMVVFCADAQDYEDASVGEFLKAINECLHDKDDRGDFNDRFLFVLNKCDLLNFSGNNPKLTERKNSFANYLMEPSRWGMKKGSEEVPQFNPKIFTTCAYIQYAIQQGADALTEEVVEGDEDKAHLLDEYQKFRKNTIQRKNENFLLLSACDIPEYRRKELQEQYEELLKENKEGAAVSLQTGMSCIETTIRDYIERYAYAFKVRDIMKTFDILLDSVSYLVGQEKKMWESQIKKLKEGEQERDEAEQEQKDKKKEQEILDDVEKKVDEQIKKIESIVFEDSMENIVKDMDEAIEHSEIMEQIREKDDYEKSEIAGLIRKVEALVTKELNKASERVGEYERKYKRQLQDICTALKDIVKSLHDNSNHYTLNGFKFENSFYAMTIAEMNLKTLREEVDRTKRTKENIVSKHNPVKDVKYEWWQIGKRLAQYFAADTIFETEDVDVYSAIPLIKAVDVLIKECKKLCKEMESHYKKDVEQMKENAKKMAESIPKSIREVANRLQKIDIEIAECGENICQLEAGREKMKETKEFLEKIEEKLREAGGKDV